MTVNRKWKDGWDCCDWYNSNKVLTAGQIFRDILMVESDFKVMQRLIEFNECCDCPIFIRWLKTQILLKANPKLGRFITLHGYNDGSHRGFLKERPKHQPPSGGRLQETNVLPSPLLQLGPGPHCGMSSVILEFPLIHVQVFFFANY